MKKLFFFLAVGATIGLTSCSKNACYECTLPTAPGCVVNICEGDISTSGTCAGIPAIPTQGLTNEQVKNAYEQSGFNCVKQ